MISRNAEPDPFEGVIDARRPGLEDPYVVVVVGKTGKTGKRQYANVVGPFPNRREATNFAVGSRKKARREGDLTRYQLTFHVRPMMDPKEITR